MRGAGSKAAHWILSQTNLLKFEYLSRIEAWPTLIITRDFLGISRLRKFYC